VIDEMTMFQVEELMSYWLRHPPVHLLLAAQIGVERERDRPMLSNPVEARRGSDEDAASMLAGIGPGFGIGDVHAGLPPAILDFAELARRTAGRS